MTPFKYSPAGYRIKVRESKNPHLLVEGRDDKNAFECLRDELEQVTKVGTRVITLVVDTAELISEPGACGLSNRDLVELTCSKWNPDQFGNKLIGFVDREYRGFDSETGQDEVNGHRVEGVVVWSRGHSIENYLFDLRIARSVFRAVGLGDFAATFNLFELTFASALRVACAVAMAAHESGKLQLVAGSISWRELRISESTLLLDVNAWRDRLLEKLRCSAAIADQLTSAYECWLEKFSNKPDDFVRWACHGHVGLSVLWTAFARSVFEVSGDNAADRLYRMPNDMRIGGLVNHWATLGLRGEVLAPLIVFTLLEIWSADNVML